MRRWLRTSRVAPPEAVDVSVKLPGREGALSLWLVVATNDRGHRTAGVVLLAVDAEGKRRLSLGKVADELFHAGPVPPSTSRDATLRPPSESIEPTLLRALVQRGAVRNGQPHQAELIGWVDATAL